jgi:hypothetical protein
MIVAVVVGARATGARVDCLYALILSSSRRPDLGCADADGADVSGIVSRLETHRGRIRPLPIVTS